MENIGATFGWFYILSANFFVIAMVVLAAGKFGSIRLGGPDALPEFSAFSWYAMLISAGMGIGLMFWSVAEPVYHYAEPSPMFDILPRSPQASQSALVGLSLAFFAYNRGLPLTIRSIFYPLLGDRI